jgi:hypothetical protein
MQRFIVAKRRESWQSKYAALDWEYIVTRGLVIGLSVGVAFVVAIPFLIVANAR